MDIKLAINTARYNEEELYCIILIERLSLGVSYYYYEENIAQFLDIDYNEFKKIFIENNAVIVNNDGFYFKMKTDALNTIEKLSPYELMKQLSLDIND